MVSQRRISQIIAAEGWLAVYDVGTGDVTDIRTRPLVCWALMEEPGGAGGTSVVGLDADYVAGAAGASGMHGREGDHGRFLGYVRVGESLARFRKD